MPIGGIPTGWDIRVCYYSAYLSSLEKFLENEARTLDERYDAKAQEIIAEGKKRANRSDHTSPPQLDEVELELRALDYFFEERRRELEDIFANILRRSFFVAIYSLIEAQLNAICCEQERAKGLESSVEDLTEPDKGIRRARKYLQRVGIRLQDIPEWNELTNYQKLRNCIVHNEGKLESGHEKHKGARQHLKEQFIPRNRDLLEWKELDDEIIFHKGFCEKVFQVSYTFFTDLFAVLTNEEEGDF
jgi:hypothetical protein